jgi:outer membrane autotransporter protein
MLINNGVITGDLKGVSGSDDCTRPIYITNSGTIRGSQYAIQTGAGDDRITTNGLIDGNIATRKGNDTVNVYGGLITGSIDGGEGSNILNFNLPGDTTFAYFNNISNFGDVNVNSGTTRLNGQVSGEVAVASGATFGGNATLSGNLTNSGNVGPGNSIGTITVNGNYTQNAGGHLLIEVAKNSSGVLFGDQLIVDHTATFASGSIIDVSFGAGSSRVLSNNDTFRFITAGSLVDNGSQIAFESIFLNVTNNLGTLTLHRTATFASVARPGNNASMASTFDADAAAAAGTYAGLINQLLFTNAIVFNQSLQQFGPAAYLDVNAATDRTTQYMAESLGGYLRTRRAGTVNPSPSQYTSYQGASAFAKAVGSPCELAETVKFCANERTMIREMPEIDRTRSVWVNPFGAFYGERSNGDHLGFQSNVAGVQFGIDKQADENCILGIGGGYDQMHINTADFDSAGKTDTFRVGPYASWYDDEWYVDSSLTGGFHDNNIGRLVSVGEDDWMSKGLYHANDLSFYLGGGRDRHIGDYVVTPMLSMQYIYYRQNGFTESDGDNVALAVDPLDAQSLRSRVGGQLARTYQWGCAKIVPEVFAGWAHEYLQNDVLEARFVGGVTPFSTDRGGIFRDAGYYGASLTTLPRKHASLFARYNGEYSTGGHFAAVDLGMIVEF